MVNSKQKGKVGEREVVHFLKDRGIYAERGQQFKGSPDSPDVICPYLQDYHIEVKRTEKLSVYKALGQAGDDAGEDQVPVVFHRRSREDWIVILDADEFLKLVKRDLSKG